LQDFALRFDGPEERRLDHFLAGALPQFSRSRLQDLIRKGAVLVDGERARKAGQLLSVGSRISMQVPPAVSAGLVAEDIALQVVFEDNNVLVVNKPAGLVVHPGAGHRTGTLVNAALAHDPSMMGVGGEERPGVVHRLDKDTSGLLVLAKNDAAMKVLQDQFQGRAVRKTYLALVDGRPPTATGRIQAAIGRDPIRRKRMSILPEGKGRGAETEYTTVEVLGEHTLLEVHPITGRTHQIRLHLSFLGCPIAGDTVYGRRRRSIALERHFLHAWKLEVALPDAQDHTEFVAPLPAELEEVLALLRAKK